MEAHKEIHFEDFIVDYLGDHGCLVGDAAKYDRIRARYAEDLIGYIRDAQPAAGQKLEKLNGAGTEKLVLDRTVKALETSGTLEVLRRGVSIAGGGKLILCQAVPEDTPDRDWSLDLAFFINGIPVATAELKSDFTRSVQDATAQCRNDRNPKDKTTGRTHPLLSFKRGALVHFAVSTTETHMATRLSGTKTLFLPFNLGYEDARSWPICRTIFTCRGLGGGWRLCCGYSGAPRA